MKLSDVAAGEWGISLRDWRGSYRVYREEEVDILPKMDEKSREKKDGEGGIPCGVNSTRR